MTDYDAVIHRLKLDAMRALKAEVHLPLYPIAPGDAQALWDRVLNKVVAPALGELMSAMIMRDVWEMRTDRKQEQIGRWIVSCLDVQTELEKANRRIGELEDQLEAEQEAVRLRDGQMRRAYMNGALAGVQGDIDPEDLVEEKDAVR